MNKRQLKTWRDSYTEWAWPVTGEGLRLAVHFDEKDFVKRLGAKWKPAPNGAKGGYWWMPESNLTKCVSKMGDIPEYINVFVLAAANPGQHAGKRAAAMNEQDTLCPEEQTVLEFLNKNKMVYGPHGVQNPKLCEEACKEIDPLTQEVYHLISVDQSEEVNVTVFREIGLVYMAYATAIATSPMPAAAIEWQTAEDARIQWEGLVAQGFYRTVSEEID